MKNFIATLKAYIMAAVAWFCKWEKDKILHFALADNIVFVAWIGTTILLGWCLGTGWATAICAVITCALILLKDCWIDPSPDWYDILASLLGLLWALLKIGLIWFCTIRFLQ